MKWTVVIGCALAVWACGSDDETARSPARAAAGAAGSAPAGGSAGMTGAAGMGSVGQGSGAQLSVCSSDDDCAAGLDCYTFGNYCSRRCAIDAECQGLGATYTCYVVASRSMRDGGTPMANGTCRIACTGTSDTSCPSGMTCVDVGGGAMMGGTFRCAYPDPPRPGRSGAGRGGRSGGAGLGGAGGA